MTAVNLAPVMTSLRDLPALTSVVLDLIHSLGREDVDVTALAEKMSRDQAHGELLKKLKTPDDRLPFPAPQPQAPPAPKK